MPDGVVESEPKPEPGEPAEQEVEVDRLHGLAHRAHRAHRVERLSRVARSHLSGGIDGRPIREGTAATLGSSLASAASQGARISRRVVVLERHG